MQQNNNNFSPLPFYKSIGFQNHRKNYAYGKVYPLYCQNGFLLPFQIVRNYSGGTLTTIQLLTAAGQVVGSLNSSVINTFVNVYTWAAGSYPYGSQAVSVIVGYNISNRLFNGYGDGQYYLRVSDGVNTWYSDIFTWVDSVDTYLKITWYDFQNLYFDNSAIIYNNNNGDNVYKNYLILPNELGKPEYQFEEEGEERNGFYFPQKQISEKVYKCTILAPEYLLDVMRLIRLSDYVVIRDPDGVQYICDKFLMTPKWLAQGDLASVELEFQTDTVVKKCGKGLTSTIVSNGDFNNDFNDDFLI